MIKAIETQYRGYRFRSRLEARWAVFFDALGIRWEYEPEGLVLSSGPYLPDFWLPEHSLWVEIKGRWANRREIELACDVGAEQAIAIFSGLPGEHFGDPQGGSAWLFEPADLSHQVIPFDGEIWFERDGTFGVKYATGVGFNDPPLNLWGPAHATHAARSARFEHGEKPAIQPRLNWQRSHA